MILDTVLSGVAGGVMRLVPEVMGFFDRKNERAHEATMMDKEIQILDKNLGAEMHKSDNKVDEKAITGIVEALKGQAEMVKAVIGIPGWIGKFLGGTVGFLSAMVRPVVTYWMFTLYSMVKVYNMQYMKEVTEAAWSEVLTTNWTQFDQDMLAMILMFWFVGRVYDRRKSP